MFRQMTSALRRQIGGVLPSVLRSLAGSDAASRASQDTRDRPDEPLAPREAVTGSERAPVSTALPAPVSSPSPPTGSAGQRRAGQAPQRNNGLGVMMLFRRGILQPGMQIHFPGKEALAATVIDGRKVDFKGDIMGYTAWGLRVTGHKAVNVSRDCLTDDGTRLGNLR